MITQQKQLEEALTNDGWKVVSRDKSPPDWWADEIWKIESVWSPVGLMLFIIFLVDPQWDGNRRKGEHVWAVGAALDNQAAQSYPLVDAEIFLLRKWEERMPKFVAELSDLRNISQNC